MTARCSSASRRRPSTRSTARSPRGCSRRCSSTRSRSCSAATSRGSSRRPAPASPATPRATRCTASCRPRTRRCRRAPGPSSSSCREDNFAGPRPAGIDTEAAGAAPLAGITALLAIDALELAAGDTLLVIGATGGVGSFAVQLAARAGATILAPGFAEDADYLQGLGVAELLDRDGDVVAAVRERHPDGIDALLDLVSYTPDAFAAHAALLAPDGRGASPLMVAGDAPGRANIVAQSSPENLERLGALLAAGDLIVPIHRRYAFAEAGTAFADLSTIHKHGKLAIQIG